MSRNTSKFFTKASDLGLFALTEFWVICLFYFKSTKQLFSLTKTEPQTWPGPPPQAPHPTTTTNFSASRRAKKLKFCTDIHYANLIHLTNCHYNICPGNICLGDICPYQEYLSSYWSDFHQTLKVGSWDHIYEMPTFMVTFVQATYALVTFVYIRNISDVTCSILTKL